MADFDELIARATPKVDFSAIGDLPKTYWEGLDQKAKQEQRNLFREGVPTTPDGQLDYNAVMKKMLQTGGTPAIKEAVGLGNLDIGQQQMKYLGGLESGTGYPATGQPPVQSSGMPPPISSRSSPSSSVPVQSSPRIVGDDEGVRRGIYDAPTIAGARPPIQADATTPNVPSGPPAMAPTPAGQPPIGPDARTAAAIQRLTVLSSSPIESVAKAATVRLQDLLKSQQLTPDMQNYALSMKQRASLGQPPVSYDEYQRTNETQKAQSAAQGKAFSDKYTQVIDLGNKAFQELPQIAAIQRLMNDPNFYSGIGEKYNLAFKRILTAVGGDPNTAVPQEAFRKVISGTILNSLAALKGLGQIRVAEINLAKEASASSDNSPAANRMLVEISKRTYERAEAVAELAQKYKGGNLDAGFDRVVTDYYKRVPLFSDQELKNPKLLTLPRFNSPQEVKASRMPSGTQFLDSTGTPRVVP